MRPFLVKLIAPAEPIAIATVIVLTSQPRKRSQVATHRPKTTTMVGSMRKTLLATLMTLTTCHSKKPSVITSRTKALATREARIRKREVKAPKANPRVTHLWMV